MTRATLTLRPVWIGAAAFVALILGANLHLAYVAFSSAPPCVAHAKLGSAAGGAITAAKSSC